MGKKRDVSAGQSGPHGSAAVETPEAAPAAAGYKDRIIGLRRVPASQLRDNPRNWRTHPPEQKAALEGMLARVGIANAVIARELPDGTLELIDGHLRANSLEGQEIPVLVLDVDETEAGEILATMDPLAAMAGMDGGKLEALLASFTVGEGGPLDAFISGLAADASTETIDELARKPSSLAKNDSVKRFEESSVRQILLVMTPEEQEEVIGILDGAGKETHSEAALMIFREYAAWKSAS